jgi:hypothetical protein
MEPGEQRAAVLERFIAGEISAKAAAAELSVLPRSEEDEYTVFPNYPLEVIAAKLGELNAVLRGENGEPSA